MSQVLLHSQMCIPPLQLYIARCGQMARSTVTQQPSAPAFGGLRVGGVWGEFKAGQFALVLLWHEALIFSLLSRLHSRQMNFGCLKSPSHGNIHLSSILKKNFPRGFSLIMRARQGCRFKECMFCICIFFLQNPDHSFDLRVLGLDHPPQGGSGPTQEEEGTRTSSKSKIFFLELWQFI